MTAIGQSRASPPLRFHDKIKSGPVVSILLPCWNALGFTRACIRQIEKWTSSPYELILIDNGSIDGTARWLDAFRNKISKLSAQQSHALKRIHVISNPVNRGYTAAMNQGLAAGRGEYLVFGNADAAVSPFWLEGMLAAFQARSCIGAISPLSNILAEEAWHWPGFYKNFSEMERFAIALFMKNQKNPFTLSEEFIPGYWLMCRRSDVLDLGGFDESFHPGPYADTDLQWRLRRAGLTLGFADQSFVHHCGSAICKANKVDPRKLYSSRRHLTLLRSKHEDLRHVFLKVRTPVQEFVFCPGTLPPS